MLGGGTVEVGFRLVFPVSTRFGLRFNGVLQPARASLNLSPRFSRRTRWSVLSDDISSIQ
jgi:hypothetical protein